jgi:folate-binding protein YgfZ
MSTVSPFTSVQAPANAAFAERFGVMLPEHFGNPEAEYRTVREAAGLVDLSFRGLLCLEGSERLRWLNGQITQDVKALRPGQGVRAAALTVKGRILADLVVLGRPDAVWIDLPRQRAEVVREAFDRHIIADDVRVTDASSRLARLAVLGPEAPARLAGILGDSAAALPPYAHIDGELAGSPVTVLASRRLRSPGFDLFLPAEAAGAVWQALAAGGLAPVGMAALEVLRIEAGWPWQGPDFGEEQLLMEALTADRVSFTKGCYLGQEVVIRIEHQGHLNKRLCGLVVTGDAVPPVGATLHSGERAVGSLTSAAWSPALRRPIALGYVRRESWDPGTALRVAWEGGEAEAAVAALPFVSEAGSAPEPR